jgi:anti-sigma B factor antagonist
VHQPQVSVSVRQGKNGVNVIDLAGQVTAAAEAPLSDAYEKASAEARAVILNFSQLEYMNSSGIGLIVTLLIRANRQGKRLCAVGLSDHYKEIFLLTRLSEAIKLFDTEQAALAAN